MSSRPRVYIIGSLRNPRVPDVANALRAAGFDVFDDWFAVGPDADEYWRKFEQGRGNTYLDALTEPAAVNTFEFDYNNLCSSDAVVMIAPSGKSAHLELGFMLGKGKPGWVLMEAEPDRWDVMLQFVYLTGGRPVSSLNDLINDMADYFDDKEIPF